MVHLCHIESVTEGYITSQIESREGKTINEQNREIDTNKSLFKIMLSY
jgi:hypothetical protein